MKKVTMVVPVLINTPRRAGKARTLSSTRFEPANLRRRFDRLQDVSIAESKAVQPRTVTPAQIVQIA